MYTTQQDVRDLLGVSEDRASDDLLEEFIEIAQNYVRAYIQIEVLDEGLGGSLDGVNNTFNTEYPFWANVTGNPSISTSDFTVWAWPNSEDPFGRVKLSISTFDPLRGIVVLSSAPDPDEYEKLTIDYSYYTKKINWSLLAIATAWKAAELWVKREEFLVPETWVIGNKRMIQRQPWTYFEVEFNRVIDKMIALPMDKVSYAKLVFRPRGPEGPEVDSSYSKEIITEGVYSPEEEIAEEVQGA